ncbi:hypothetical protein Ciccas_002484 [Cichlidogyrus casuarinus]|uniref:RGS domain-containing protein n=1 Tax=Cichlidogyrus casuarinus TaxID=1844966 RepID=A0ABD2QH36_9PLAT
MFNWIKDNRLDYFLKTDLFRELKLCKLLLDSYEISAYTKTTGMSSSTDFDPTSKDEPNDDDYDEYEVTDYDKSCSTREGSFFAHRVDSVSLYQKQVKFRRSREKLQNSTSTAQTTVVSAPSTEQDSSTGKISRLSLDKSNFEGIRETSSNSSHYNCDEEYDRALETEIQLLENRQCLSIKKLKDFLLGSFLGMRNFLAFLSNKQGNNLVNFWLDCEIAFDGIGSNTDLQDRVHAFRSILNRYNSFLPQYPVHLLRNGLSTISSLDEFKSSEAIFRQAQYDVLCRLRSYWIPRWLLHWEHRVTNLRLSPSLMQPFTDRTARIRTKQNSKEPTQNLGPSTESNESRLPEEDSEYEGVSLNSQEWYEYSMQALNSKKDDLESLNSSSSFSSCVTLVEKIGSKINSSLRSSFASSLLQDQSRNARLLPHLDANLDIAPWVNSYLIRGLFCLGNSWEKFKLGLVCPSKNPNL